MAPFCRRPQRLANHKARMNYTGFYTLRNDRTMRIDAVRCMKCRKYLAQPRNRDLVYHRQRCNDREPLNDEDQNFPVYQRMDVDNEMYVDNGARSPGTAGFPPENPINVLRLGEDINTNRLRMGTMTWEDGYWVEIEGGGLAHEKWKIDEALARFLFANAIALVKVDCPYFHAFIRALRPQLATYSPPTRKTLSTTILTRFHGGIVQDRISDFSGGPCCMLSDGHLDESSKRKMFACTIRNETVAQAYSSSFDVTLEKEDIPTLQLYRQRAVDHAHDQYGTKVVVAIVDNAKAMVGAFKLIRNVDGELLIVATCLCHSGSLLMEDLIFESFVKSVKSVAHEFSKPKINAKIEALGGTRVKNYPDTRFEYIQDTLLSIRGNVHILVELLNDAEVSVNDEARVSIRSPEFIRQMDRAIILLAPISTLVKKCQDPKSTLAEGTAMWLNLRPHFANNQRHKNLYEERTRRALSSTNYAAIVLNHRYGLPFLNENQQTMAFNLINERLPDDHRDELDRYLDQATQVSLTRYRDLEPSAYWIIIEDQFPHLSKLTRKILLLPPSTALIEGLFSHAKYVKNPYRGKLLSIARTC